MTTPSWTTLPLELKFMVLDELINPIFQNMKSGRGLYHHCRALERAIMPPHLRLQAPSQPKVWERWAVDKDSPDLHTKAACPWESTVRIVLEGYEILANVFEAMPDWLEAIRQRLGQESRVWGGVVAREELERAKGWVMRDDVEFSISDGWVWRTVIHDIQQRLGFAETQLVGGSQGERLRLVAVYARLKVPITTGENEMEKLID